jgi:hypothetical protein
LFDNICSERGPELGRFRQIYNSVYNMIYV